MCQKETSKHFSEREGFNVLPLPVRRRGPGARIERGLEELRVPPGWGKLRPSATQLPRTRFCQLLESAWKWILPQLPNKSPGEQHLDLGLRPGTEKPVKPAHTCDVQKLQKIYVLLSAALWNLLWHQQETITQTLWVISMEGSTAL